MGAIVLSTTRDDGRFDRLRELGVDHPILDDGDIAEDVCRIVPEGVDAALELVGTQTLPDTLHTVRSRGTVCFTGALSEHWTIQNFNPIAQIPTGVRLTAYAGEASDLPADVLHQQLEAIAEGRIKVAVAHVYHGLEQVGEAQASLETGTMPGKRVVVLD